MPSPVQSFYDVPFETRSAGKVRFMRCPFHNDGERPDQWSMALYNDGWFHCFGCGRHGRIADLVVYAASGVAPTAQPIVVVNGRQYVRNPAYAAAAIIERAARSPNPDPPASIGPVETAFLRRVRSLSRLRLYERFDALQYLRERGVSDPRALTHFGYLSVGDVDALHKMASEAGDPDLPYRLGFVQREGKNAHQLHWMMRRGVIAWSDDARQFQVRRIRPKSGPRFFTPPFPRRPLTMNADADVVLACEGVFKAAWALPYVGVVAMLGIPSSDVHDVRYEQFRRAAQRIVVVPDNDHGESAFLNVMRNALAACHAPLRILRPPPGFKDLDSWAASAGYAEATYRLLGLLRNAVRQDDFDAVLRP